MTENKPERYQHKSLQNGSTGRLVTLLPGGVGTPLRCQIIEVQDFENTPYEALSYTWGNEILSESVQVYESADIEQADRLLPLTRNLSEALQRLRSDEPQTLWIDALCIDQDNHEEKANQVARMGRVFRNASNVVVWLGEDKNYPRTRALLTQDGRNRWPLTLPEADLGELMSISWFSRVWAVQEYVLPRSIVFRLGTLSIPAQHLETVVTRTGAYLDGEKRLYDQWKSICLLFEYRKLMQERSPDQSDARLTLVRTFLDLTRSRLCKDSRDRIYGILGMFDNVNIVPDYTLAPRQVYQDFVSKHLLAGDFSILHECCIGIPNADEQSYVPFFGQSRSHTKYIPFVDPLSATYCAGLHMSPAVTIDDDKFISVQGSFIDTVQQKLDFSEDCEIDLDLIDPSSPMQRSSLEPVQLPLHGTWGAIYQTILAQLITDPTEQLRWRKDFDENRISPQFSRAPYPHNSFFEVLVHAIRTDLNADYDWLSSKGTVRPDAHLRRPRRDILAERSLFWTEQGFVGLGTCHMQPGDEVVVLAGDTTPFLLRKEARSDEKDAGAYKIVSDCFLYGWMYGSYPDRMVAKDPSRRRSLVKKLKGGSKQESRPSPALRTFTIT
ncbi:heterokaryon incompatibility protein-domain-containing protein [Boeremia exigua]|uniref:heterokaryon incompatibility protein-domain-containing protein n=1 Tax=Boeremia exigua TaxID=749465 RepID=UPI001E8D12FD|nr:heterokaryon incompatibility protein-domain-containing protein [Boeremia exigua]KAH6639190.1 heterokaryon incompatibility protein-domain-containing protein [Boeremia exigua]